MQTKIVFAVLVLVFIFANNPIYGTENQMNKNKNESTAELLERADKVFKSREYDQSREIYLQAAERAREADENSALTEAYSQIARSYLITDKKEEGRDWLSKAESIATDTEPLGWSRYLGVRGRFEWQDKEIEKATATFKAMYNFCSTEKLYERAIDATHMVAITGLPEEQVVWGKKGIREAEAGNITGWLGPLWNNLGGTYEDLKKYNEAVEAYLEAREYHWRYGDEKNKLIADWAVGHAYRLNGEFEKAAQWIRPVLSWCERIDEVEFTGWCCKELAEVEISNENYKSVLTFLKRAEKNLKKAGMPDWHKEGYEELLAQINEIEGKSGE